MIRKHFHLTSAMLSDLEKVAKSTGLPVSELVRRAINDYLESIAKERKNERR